MAMLDQDRQDIIARCQALRSMIPSTGSPNDPDRLSQWYGVIRLVNNFEVLTHWYTNALEAALDNQAGGDTQTTLYWNVEMLYAELEHLQETVVQVVSPLQTDWRDLLVHFSKGVLETLNQDIYSPHNLTVLVREGRDFRLTRYFFCPEVLTLTIPVSAVTRPGRWSMIWHELGSLLVFPSHKKPLALIHSASKLSTNSFDQITRAVDKLRNDLEGSSLFSAALISRIYPSANPAGNGTARRAVVIRNYVEELIEDSISIVALGSIGFLTLREALGNNYGIDRQDNGLLMEEDRHPPPVMRLLVAHELMTQIGLDVSDLAEEKATLDQLMAKQASEIRLEVEEIVQKLAQDVRTVIAETPLIQHKAGHWTQKLVQQAVADAGASATTLRQNVPDNQARLPIDLSSILKGPDPTTLKEQMEIIGSAILNFNGASRLTQINQTKAEPERSMEISKYQRERIKIEPDNGNSNLLGTGLLDLNTLSELIFSLDDPGANCPSGCSRRCCKNCNSLNCPRKCCK
jgi:hypothetical protein